MKKTKKVTYKKRKRTYKKKRQTYKKKSYKKGGAKFQYSKVYDNLEQSIEELNKLNGSVDISKLRSLKNIQKKLVDKKPDEIRPELLDLIKRLNLDIFKNGEIFYSNIFMNLLYSLKKLNKLNNLQKKKNKEIFEETRKNLRRNISEQPKYVKESEFYDSIGNIRDILNKKNLSYNK